MPDLEDISYSDEDKKIRVRCWWFILYPESAPVDWLNCLDSELIPCAISPLHDADIRLDGSPKKPHRHIILRYDNTTTYNHVLELTRRYNATIPLRIESFKGAYDYLTHKNHPDKAQYSSDDIILLNGFSPPPPDSKEVNMKLYDLLSLIRDNNITEIYELVNLCLNVPEYSKCINLISRNSYLINATIRSNRHRLIRISNDHDSEFLEHSSLLSPIVDDSDNPFDSSADGS